MEEVMDQTLYTWYLFWSLEWWDNKVSGVSGVDQQTEELLKVSLQYTNYTYQIPKVDMIHPPHPSPHR